jgi:hypothetical protein
MIIENGACIKRASALEFKLDIFLLIKTDPEQLGWPIDIGAVSKTCLLDVWSKYQNTKNIPVTQDSHFDPCIEHRGQLNVVFEE